MAPFRPRRSARSRSCRPQIGTGRCSKAGAGFTLGIPEQGAETFLLKMPVVVRISVSPSFRIVCIEIQSTKL